MNEFEPRRSAIRDTVQTLGLDALVVGDARNRRYLSGFTGSAGYLVVGAGTLGDHLVADGRYYDQARSEAPDVRLVEGGSKVLEALGGALDELGATTVGFEADAVTVSVLERLQRTSEHVTWRPTTGVVEGLRQVKDAAEIERITRAVRLADRAMEHAFATARPGMSERELAWSIERFMRENGAEAVAFDTIVAAGENSARPHHHPGQRPIAAGEAIVIDLGARVDGYHSDITRTICIGQPTDPALIAEVVDFASFESLQQKERERFFDSDRLGQTRSGDPETGKVRRGRVGGYRDQLCHETILTLDRLVRENLDPIYGYA